MSVTAPRGEENAVQRASEPAPSQQSGVNGAGLVALLNLFERAMGHRVRFRRLLMLIAVLVLAALLVSTGPDLLRALVPKH